MRKPRYDYNVGLHQVNRSWDKCSVQTLALGDLAAFKSLAVGAGLQGVVPSIAMWPEDDSSGCGAVGASLACVATARECKWKFSGQRRRCFHHAGADRETLAHVLLRDIRRDINHCGRGDSCFEQFPLHFCSRYYRAYAVRSAISTIDKHWSA